MKKIKIISKLINDNQMHEIVCTGQLKENRIIYYDNKVKVVIRSDDFITLTRENDDYFIELILKPGLKTESTYLLKSVNKKIILNTYTKSIINTDENINIEYEIIDQDSSELYKYNLNYEVIE